MLPRTGSIIKSTTPYRNLITRILTFITILSLFLSEIPDSEASESTRSGKVAFLLSFLLPGIGQIYAGDSVGARTFLGLEAAIWSTTSAFSIYSGWLKDGYKNFAAARSGADTRGKKELFFKDLGLYSSIYERNRMARWEDGPDAEVYPESPEWIWEWDSESSIAKYRQLRRRSKSAHRRALFMGFAVAINHFISAVHASRVAGKPRIGENAILGVEPTEGDGFILNMRLRI
jgi:hypothetical protein